MKIACAILAGGKNLRMNGVSKAFLKIKGIPLVDTLLKVVTPLFEEVMIITNTPLDYMAYTSAYGIFPDVLKNIGPLGGIHSAIVNTSLEAVFCIACDMPFLEPQLITRLVNTFNEKSCDAILPRIKSNIEPVHAIYKKDLAPQLADFVQKNGNYSIRGFLQTIKASYLDLTDTPYHQRLFRNINTVEDYQGCQ